MLAKAARFRVVAETFQVLKTWKVFRSEIKALGFSLRAFSFW